MDEMTAGKPRGSRRRLTFWAMFGTVGLIMGAAYATGFASTTNTDATNTTTGTPTLGSPSGANPNLYGGLVTPHALSYTFDGYYGTFVKTDMFTVDLTVPDGQGHTPLAGETYYVDVVIANWTQLQPDWDTVDMNFKIMDCTASSPATYASASATQMLNVDRVDAHVTFSGLAGAKKYCIGLDTATSATEEAALAAAGSTGAVADTVLFRVSTASAPANVPQFAATLNRSA